MPQVPTSSVPLGLRSLVGGVVTAILLAGFFGPVAIVKAEPEPTKEIDPAAGPAQPGDTGRMEPVIILDIAAINSGDTAWMLASTALVLMMTGPGLALFYAGLVRRKNVLSSLMQSFICMAAMSVLWALLGYSLAFSTGNPYVGGFDFVMLRGVGAAPCEYAATIPHTLWMAFQMMFAIITPALICGASAERMKFSAMLVFSSIWLLLVYCPLAHMVWGKGGLFNAFLGGTIPALDFAGGTVVHISSGVSALVAALMLGKRQGYGIKPMTPHSVVLSVIGASLLWVGWFGFNGGSALAANGLAAHALITTHFAAAAAALGWVAAECIRGGKPTVLGVVSGAVVGLVVVTPAAGFTTPIYAMLMGLIGGVVCFWSATSLKHICGYDDSLDAFGVHGVGGVIGSVLTGVFAVSSVNPAAAQALTGSETGAIGLLWGNSAQLVNQIKATALTVVFAAVATYVILKIIDRLIGLRVSREEEFRGLDLSQHGEAGYNFDEL